MAITYRINGYLVDANGDDNNLVDFQHLFERNTDLIGTLDIDNSPEWEWTDDCPENSENCSKEDYSCRFDHPIQSNEEIENVFSTIAKYFSRHCLFLRFPNTSDAWTLNEENWIKLMRGIADGNGRSMEDFNPEGKRSAE